MDTEHTAITEPVRRIEVFTGTGRRRAWSADDKARIVAESVTSGESVCAVARRYGLSPQQLFGWRRQARQPREATAGDARLFVPAVVESARAEAPLPVPSPGTQAPKRVRRTESISGLIEVEIGGVTVRAGRGADVKMVAAVIRVLKAGS
jgi:transposase